MRTVAVLPVKRFSRAKQRLSSGLEPVSRAVLAEAMVGDVLAALRRVPAIDRIVMVSGENATGALAEEHGAELLVDHDETGQSDAARRGIARAIELGAERVLLVPGDCPALAPAEVTALLEGSARSPGVVVIPDRHGTGTNALVLSPPDAIEPAFGPGSRARHERLAAEAGVSASVEAIPSLALDIDTPADLDALLARDAAVDRTAAVLASLDRRVVAGG